MCNADLQSVNPNDGFVATRELLMFNVKYRLKKTISDVSGTTFQLAKMRFYCSLNIAIDNDARRTRRMRNIHQGRRAFVIGNGPSLKMSDLDRIKDEICFASNKIYLAYGETDWRPTYHMVEDDQILSTSKDIFRNLENQMFLSTDALAVMDRLPNAIYYARDFGVNPSAPSFQYCPLGHIWSGYTVLYSCLQFALYFGITEVYLIGVDFNYTKPPNVIRGEGGNTDVYIADGERNHFHPDYNSAGESWYDPNLKYQETAFAKAKDVFETNGRRIFNATRGGLLEVFPRVDFDSLF